MREKRYYVYIMSSKGRVLYIGVTGFLMARTLQHKAEEVPGFTRRYHVNRLVYYEVFRYINNAIAREKEIKKWRRERKIALIERDNPLWQDLAAEWGKTIALKKQIPHRQSGFGMTNGPPPTCSNPPLSFRAQREICFCLELKQIPRRYAPRNDKRAEADSE